MKNYSIGSGSMYGDYDKLTKVSKAIRFSIQDKKNALQNALISFKFPKKYFIHTADKRCGESFALATNGELGSINIHSEFMNYKEFNCYLKGWYDAKMKKF